MQDHMEKLCAQHLERIENHNNGLFCFQHLYIQLSTSYTWTNADWQNISYTTCQKLWIICGNIEARVRDLFLVNKWGVSYFFSWPSQISPLPALSIVHPIPREWCLNKRFWMTVCRSRVCTHACISDDGYMCVSYCISACYITRTVIKLPLCHHQRS